MEKLKRTGCVICREEIIDKDYFFECGCHYCHDCMFDLCTLPTQHFRVCEGCGDIVELLKLNSYSRIFLFERVGINQLKRNIRTERILRNFNVDNSENPEGEKPTLVKLYHILALHFHPDKNNGKTTAQFQHINTLYSMKDYDSLYRIYSGIK